MRAVGLSVSIIHWLWPAVILRGPLYRVAQNMVADFQQQEQVRREGKQGGYQKSTTVSH